MVVYIAGKMNGLPDKGKNNFAEAEAMLKEMGFTVLNPACLPDGLPGDRYMPTCLTMVDTADILVLLPDWIYSPGAMLEKAFAEYQGKMVFELGGLEKVMGEWRKLLASTWERTHGDCPCQTFPGFIRNHCRAVESPVVNIGYVDQLKKQIKQLAVERDAAVEDLENIVRKYGESYCEYCKHNNKKNYCAGRCWTHNEGFDWRGVKEE